MKNQKINILFNVVMMVVLKESECAMPGTFFWKPRMAIDLRAAEQADSVKRVKPLTKKNIREGRVALIAGYRVGAAMIAIGSVGARGRPQFPQMDVTSSAFYTDVYRWTLRALSLIPEWMTGDAGKFPTTQQVWKKRFHHMNDQVPQWLRTLLFYVDDWDEQEWVMKRFDHYARPSFDKHLKYPSQNPYNEEFASFLNSKETAENLDDSPE